MTDLQQNILKINSCEEALSKSECRYDALSNLKELDALYDERVKLLKEDDHFGYYHAHAAGSSKSIKLVISVLEKL